MSKRPDPLGDRMKEFEMAEAGRTALPGIPLLARLDGRAFHTFTAKLARPYDARMSTAMVETTRELVREFKPSIGYTQSDEITLLFPRPEVLFGGRYQKLTSILAGFASSVFSDSRELGYWATTKIHPCFDCRVWQVPDRPTALEVFQWREDDAVKNSVSMAASAVYSHKALMNKSSKDKMEMLHEKGINWNDYPAFFKRGTYLQRKNIEKEIDDEERLKIPEKHRPPAGTKVMRTVVEALDMPPIRRLSPEGALALLFPAQPEES